MNNRDNLTFIIMPPPPKVVNYLLEILVFSLHIFAPTCKSSCISGLICLLIVCAVFWFYQLAQ